VCCGDRDDRGRACAGRQHGHNTRELHEGPLLEGDGVLGAPSVRDPIDFTRPRVKRWLPSGPAHTGYASSRSHSNFANGGLEANRGRPCSHRPPLPSDPRPTFSEHMFPTLTARRPNKRSLRELVRGAVGTALEFATLGEATLGSAAARQPAPQPDLMRHGRPSAPTAAHPHRRRINRQPRARRPGAVGPRAQVCRTPVHRPATRRH